VGLGEKWHGNPVGTIRLIGGRCEKKNGKVFVEWQRGNLERRRNKKKNRPGKAGLQGKLMFKINWKRFLPSTVKAREGGGMRRESVQVGWGKMSS